MAAPHALAVREFTVDAAARDAYLARLAERRAAAAVHGANVWAFEREHAPGVFIEFVETKDRATLAAALALDATFADASPAIYHEVVTPSIGS